MTNSLLGRFDPFQIGFDSIFDSFETLQKEMTKAYPPYNIVKTGENSYLIEMAIAGFGKQNIEITLEDSVLKVSGKQDLDTDKTGDYLYKGISNKNFARQFQLADHVEVKDAEVINGMLKVFLEAITPDKKIQKIEIK